MGFGFSSMKEVRYVTWWEWLYVLLVDLVYAVGFSLTLDYLVSFALALLVKRDRS
jgi:hypothetical protein